MSSYDIHLLLTVAYRRFIALMVIMYTDLLALGSMLVVNYFIGLHVWYYKEKVKMAVVALMLFEGVNDARENVNTLFVTHILTSFFFFFLKMSSYLTNNQFLLPINFILYIIIKKNNINLYVFVLIFIYTII